MSAKNSSSKPKPPAKRAATSRKRNAVKKAEPTRHEHSAGFGVTRKFPADEAPKGDA